MCPMFNRLPVPGILLGSCNRWSIRLPRITYKKSKVARCHTTACQLKLREGTFSVGVILLLHPFPVSYKHTGPLADWALRSTQLCTRNLWPRYARFGSGGVGFSGDFVLASETPCHGSFSSKEYLQAYQEHLTTSYGSCYQDKHITQSTILCHFVPSCAHDFQCFSAAGCSPREGLPLGRWSGCSPWHGHLMQGLW